ncbi:hypothetical protein [Anaeromyxobacter oryzae]|uniref:Uncharacterized protein n=1 Tax=Anaeromyxobacter oryzae TaxID=2918170 RepID=A0ABN6MNT7_9BACT|nr:hypothetical protein [Anaeromyxobacter oryzae]BDG01334.1 hypothetical protein AMOR_03300 [Anaeromyxobacter oryzae]
MTISRQRTDPLFHQLAPRLAASGALLALLGAAPVAAADDQPPYAGSHDDASYGDTTHTTLATESGPAGEAPSGRADDTSYAGLRHATVTATVLPAGVPALASGHDDTEYPHAAATPSTALASAAAPASRAQALTARRASR